MKVPKSLVFKTSIASLAGTNERYEEYLQALALFLQEHSVWGLTLQVIEDPETQTFCVSCCDDDGGLLCYWNKSLHSYSPTPFIVWENTLQKALISFVSALHTCKDIVYVCSPKVKIPKRQLFSKYTEETFPYFIYIIDVDLNLDNHQEIINSEKE